MSAHRYKCTNLANCDKALNKEVIELDDADEKLCPECKSKLVPESEEIPPWKIAGKKKWLFAATLLLAGFCVYLLWPSGPNPEQADRMLTEFFPNLPN